MVGYLKRVQNVVFEVFEVLLDISQRNEYLIRMNVIIKHLTVSFKCKRKEEVIKCKMQNAIKFFSTVDSV